MEVPLAALTDIRNEVVSRVQALAPEGGRTARGRERFIHYERGPLDEAAGQTRAFTVEMALDSLDDTLTAGAERWRASGEVRVRYEAQGPAVRGVASEAAARDGQRVSAALRRPDGWPACARVTVGPMRVDEVIGDKGFPVALIQVVPFAALFIEEV